MNEGKKDRRDPIRTIKPRNFVAKNAAATTSGAGAHKDKKKAMKQGEVKHKAAAYSENLETALLNKLHEYQDRMAGVGMMRDPSEDIDVSANLTQDQLWSKQGDRFTLHYEHPGFQLLDSSGRVVQTFNAPLRYIESHLEDHGYKMLGTGTKPKANPNWFKREDTDENFADGRHPEDKGDAKRHGVPTKASVSTLRKVAKQGGRKGQLAHWMANMKAGRAKSESVAEGAYEDGVRDGMQGRSNPRASSIYGPETGEYHSGYAAGLEKGQQQKKAQMTQAADSRAPYEKMSTADLEQMLSDIQTRSLERQEVYSKLRGADYSFDPKKHLPANYAELKAQNEKDNNAWNTIHQVLGQRKRAGVAEGKITLSTDPNWYGAEVGDYKATGPVVNIPASQLVGFEPDDKMNQPKSRANVEKIVAGLKQGAKLPPLLVRKYKNGYQVLDGHHRFWAYKLLGVKSIPAQIVPNDDIEEKGQQGVAEGKENECPPATQDVELNLKNRQKAIDEYGYGPLNPDLPNTKFWMKKVDEWNLDSIEEAKQSLCGNCAAFDQRKNTLDCIAQGMDSSQGAEDPTIEAGDLGYCRFLKFKCASKRTCDAWVTGGPLTDGGDVTESSEFELRGKLINYLSQKMGWGVSELELATTKELIDLYQKHKGNSDVSESYEDQLANKLNQAIKKS